MGSELAFGDRRKAIAIAQPPVRLDRRSMRGERVAEVGVKIKRRRVDGCDLGGGLCGRMGRERSWVERLVSARGEVRTS